MWLHQQLLDAELHRQIRNQSITFGGNKKLKIVGRLDCTSGKRMKKTNRVFFTSAAEAETAGYRPCGHCMREAYQYWKLKQELKMDLFSTGEIENILPYDGEVYYHGRIMADRDAKHYYDRFMETIEWRNDEAIVFGKLIQTKRKVAWYGDNPFQYTYSNTTKTALPWTTELLALKKIAEDRSGTTFNSCLLNLYHDGQEGMAWHSDNEKSLGVNTVIASLSFGAERKFAFKHKTTKATVSLILEAGSLLIMQGTTQTHWLHRLPPTTKVTRPRVNLTFRTIVDQ